MELLTVALSGILLGLVWQFMLKKTILDDHRDQLFDLRDELRETFVENGWALDAPIYRRLRNLINGYLRFTERYSFGETLMLERSVRRNQELSSTLNKHLERSFHIDDVMQRAYITGLRERARRVMMSYMILSSGPLVLSLFLIVPVVFVYLVAMAVGMLIRAGGKSVALKLEQAGGVVEALLRYTVARLAHQLWDDDFVEDLSYRQRPGSESISVAA